MSWQNQFERELDRLSKSDDLQRGPATLSVHASHGCLECEVTAADTIGCAFTRFSLKTQTLVDASVDDLARLGKSLAERLNYLLEPISSLELDTEGFSLRLRSNPPQQDDNKRRYYELTARRDGEIQLCRYQKIPHQSREVIAATVTHEVLQRLAVDFDAAAAMLGEPS